MYYLLNPASLWTSAPDNILNLHKFIKRVFLAISANIWIKYGFEEWTIGCHNNDRVLLCSEGHYSFDFFRNLEVRKTPFRLEILRDKSREQTIGFLRLISVRISTISKANKLFCVFSATRLLILKKIEDMYRPFVARNSQKSRVFAERQRVNHGFWSSSAQLLHKISTLGLKDPNQSSLVRTCR